ncbi:hypothetical protein ACFW1M_06610 [Streptomyces inhibens]
MTENAGGTRADAGTGADNERSLSSMDAVRKTSASCAGPGGRSP